MKNVVGELGEWSRNILGDLEKRIKWARRKLELCRRQPISNTSVGREEVLKYRLDKLKEQRHLYWKQRAHAHWLDKGDRNTKYFHQYATERRRRSRIHRLVADDGVIVEQETEKRALITNYYQILFHSNAGNRQEELLNDV